MTEESVKFDPDLDEYAWMVRPCEMYRAEYKDCKSYKSRFHQYFIHGKTVDCDEWKKDFDNCMFWRQTQQLPFLEKVIRSEQTRKLERLTSSLRNDVWELRSTPISIEEWNRPLPDFMQARQSSSYLTAKKNLDSAEDSKLIGNNWQCTIM
ncbi:hypothetical protein CHUAL_008912 [Chamberlinius hualienensis]